MAARRAGRLGLVLGASAGLRMHIPGCNPGLSGRSLIGDLQLGISALGEEPPIFVADDIDKAWEELGPYIMHDVLSYAVWNAGNTDTASLSFATTLDELRAENDSHRILSVEEAVDFVKGGSPLPLHPLIGGLPPETAWRYRRTVAQKVEPALGQEQ